MSIYEQLSGERLFEPLPREPVEPPARTAGEEDHTDPWRYAGEPRGRPS